MLSTLTSGPYLAVIMMAIVLWWRRRITFGRQVVVSAVLTLLAFQVLFWWRRTWVLPSEADPTPREKVLATLAIVLALNTIAQLLKWLILDFAVERRRVR